MLFYIEAIPPNFFQLRKKIGSIDRKKYFFSDQKSIEKKSSFFGDQNHDCRSPTFFDFENFRRRFSKIFENFFFESEQKK